jgi:hypothetical protein
MGSAAVAQTFKQIENYTPAQLKDFIQSQGVAYHPGYICAETTTAVLRANGINTPDANTMAVSYKDFGTSVNPSDAKVGDVVYFTPYSAGTSGHVGVITGFNADGTAQVHSGNGTEVEVSNVNLSTNSHVGSIRDGGSFGGSGSNNDGAASGDPAASTGSPGSSGGAAAGPGGAAGAAGAAGGAANAAKNGMETGSGCQSAGASPAKLTGMAGLMQNLGGVAQGAAMSAGMALLSGGGIQGAMGAALGSAGGAFGNALGTDLGGAAGAFAGQTLGGALGGIVAGQNPLQALSGSAFGALSSMGGSLIPGLSNVMPPELAQGAIAGLSSALGSVARGAPLGTAMQFGLMGGLQGTIAAYAGNMTGNPALGSVAGSVAIGALNGTIPGLNTGIRSTAGGNLKFASTISSVAATVAGNQSMTASIAEAAAMKFGPVNGGYGAKARNMQDAMTFSITTLGQNISAIAADLIAIGNWDASQPMRLMQPGYICKQILDRGLGERTGLLDTLNTFQLPIAGIDNPLFDTLAQKALESIADPEAISTIKTAFLTTVHNITTLGDLTNLQIMMPASYSYMPIHNFRELGIQFAIIGISTDNTMRQVGMAFSKIETSTDLNHISQTQSPLSQSDAAVLTQTYGFGGGAMGEQTMADFIGTSAGYVHSDTIPVITAATKYITAHPASATLNTLTTKLADTLTNKYTDLGAAGDPAAGVPTVPGSIDIPGVGKFDTLDDAIHQFIILIEAEHRAILDTNDPVLQEQLKKLDVAYKASCSQLIKEANNLHVHNIDLFDETPAQPSDAESFMDNLESWAHQTGYGGPADFVERVATNDVYGDCMKYVMRQARNAAALEGLGINTDQYRLPQSQYFRDPNAFYQNLYTGNMPATPLFKLAPVFPAHPGDVYDYQKNKALAPYQDIPLLPDQKTETYIDTQWADHPTSITEGIGRTVVKNALDNYVSLVDNKTVIGSYLSPSNGSTTNSPLNADYPGGTLPGGGNSGLQSGQRNSGGFGPNQLTDSLGNPIFDNNSSMGADLLITNLNGEAVAFGKVDNTGVLLLNNEYFVTTMMQIVNRSLYGDIQTTKYNNPFNTDQMIFGVLELLAQVNSQNINALMRTVTGGLIANGLLSQLMVKFGTRRSLYDTGTSRNDPAAWGDSGPGAKPYNN